MTKHSCHKWQRITKLGTASRKEQKYSLRRPRKRQDNNNKVAVKGTEWMGMHWISLDRDRDKRWAFLERGNEHSGSGKCRDYLHWLRKYQLHKNDSVLWIIKVKGTTSNRTAWSSLLPQRSQFSQLQPGLACTIHIFNLHGTTRELEIANIKIPYSPT
jgi:hypothetical protein